MYVRGRKYKVRRGWLCMWIVDNAKTALYVYIKHKPYVYKCGNNNNIHMYKQNKYNIRYIHTYIQYCVHVCINIQHIVHTSVCNRKLTNFSSTGNESNSLIVPKSSPVATALPEEDTCVVFMSALSAFFGQIPSTSSPRILQIELRMGFMLNWEWECIS